MKMDSISMVVNMKSIAVFGCQLFPHSPINLFPVSKFSCFPLRSVRTNPPRFARLKATTTPTFDHHQESNRKFVKLQPSPWTDHFLSVSVDVLEMDALRKEIDELKPEVKKTLMSSPEKKRILMIYLLVSLGLAQHFEEEICKILTESFEKIEEMMHGEDDLYTVSIIFWVFRTYGYYIYIF